MRKYLIALGLLLCGLASGQTAEEFKEKYARQVKNVGPSGVGVETIVNKWIEAYPDDLDARESKFTYYWAKSRDIQIEPRSGNKYLGKKPVLSLKDSLGTPVNYYEVPYFDEEYFSQATASIDELIKMAPNALEYRLDKISALLDYEKESPDMAATELLNLIDYNANSHPVWTLRGQSMDADDFDAIVKEYCSSFFNLGTSVGYNSLKIVSEKMAKMRPNDADWQANLGAYYQVGEKNIKKATKYYKKALKLDPENFAAKRNMRIIEKTKSK